VTGKTKQTYMLNMTQLQLFCYMAEGPLLEKSTNNMYNWRKSEGYKHIPLKSHTAMVVCYFAATASTTSELILYIKN